MRRFQYKIVRANVSAMEEGFWEIPDGWRVVAAIQPHTASSIQVILEREIGCPPYRDTPASSDERTVPAPRRLLACVYRWPECEEGKYDPRCCRFPKSCSCDVYDPVMTPPEKLEPV